MIWWFLLIAYLSVGAYFHIPKDWNLITRILSYIFWLPMLILAFAILHSMGYRWKNPFKRKG
jgi:hypothetical protein